MNKENCALKLVDEIILYYDALSKKHQSTITLFEELAGGWFNDPKHVAKFVVLIINICFVSSE